MSEKMTTGPSMSEQASLPLAGLRVLEFGSLIAGPMAARILGDFGAEVIKAETPGQGDELRQWGTMLETSTGLLSAWWFSMARNKQMITLNLRKPEGQALALKLIEQCDIVIENFRPGRLEAWNLSYEQMQAVNPGIRHSGRELGADNHTIYRNLLGLSESEIAHFQSEGVI